MAKEWMIEALGEDHLLLPGLVRRALAANDRVKYGRTSHAAVVARLDAEAGLLYAGAPPVIEERPEPEPAEIATRPRPPEESC